MDASQGLLFRSKEVALAEAKLENEAVELKKVCLETDRPCDMLYTDISKHEESKLVAHLEYQEKLAKVAEVTTKRLAENATHIMREYLALQKEYFKLVKWLCAQVTKDKKGRKTTYWDQFKDSHPHCDIWNCYDSLPRDEGIL